jgi:glycerol-3-phosphate dehydrogenase
MVVATFSGVRPLLAGDRETDNEKSRAHAATRVQVPGSSVPVYSMGGGKWTTFRSFAEEVTDLLLDELSVERRVSTTDLAIGGGRDYPTDASTREVWCQRIAAETGLSTERVEVLLGRYGTTASVVARAVAEADDRALTNCPAYSAAEVEWIVEHERVRRLDDLVLRRTNLALLGYLSAPLLDELSVLVAAGLGLTETQREASVSATAELLRQRFGITIREDGTALSRAPAQD